MYFKWHTKNIKDKSFFTSFIVLKYVKFDEYLGF